MRESQLHQEFSAWLKKNGYVFFHSRTDRPTSQAVGDPDYVVCKNSRACFIELKVGRNRTSPAQDKRFAELAACGCHVLVCRELQAAVDHVEAEFGTGQWNRLGYTGPTHLDCTGTDGGKAAVETVQPDTGPCFGYPEGSFQPKPELFLASSRDLGQVVVRAGADGGMVYVRLATGLDQVSLGPWTGRI